MVRMEDFIFVFVVIGGVLIGLVVVLLMFMIGCIVGISGIFLGGIFGLFNDCVWCIVFVMGFIVVFIVF